jgi:hypothetical protein
MSQSTNNCTIAPFPHANKILLRIIQRQLKSDMGYESPMEQAGLRKGCGSREQIAIVSEPWTAQGNTTKMSVCFIV